MNWPFLLTQRSLVLAAALATAASAQLNAQARSWCQPPPKQRGGSPQHAQGEPPASALRQIDSAVAAEMRRERIPGLSLAIVTGNRTLWERAYGYADLEACVPATSSTVYRLASVSKTITAAAVMQLVESGRLDLDAPIQRYVPAFPTKQSPITARQLLSHLSGIRHYRGDEEFSIREYPSLTAALPIFADDSLVSPPGTRFVYSTYGYTVLGVAVETVSGMSFMDYLRRYVFLPAQVTTIRDDSVALIVAHRARGYSRDSSGAVRNAAFLNSSYKIPGGGLVSNAGDLARFGAALQRGSLVRAQTFQQMIVPARTTDGTHVPYGYGLILGEIPDLVPGAVWHGGVQQGFTSMVYLLPADRVVIAVLTNMEGIPGSLSAFTNDLARILRAGGFATHSR